MTTPKSWFTLDGIYRLIVIDSDGQAPVNRVSGRHIMAFDNSRTYSVVPVCYFDCRYDPAWCDSCNGFFGTTPLQAMGRVLRFDGYVVEGVRQVCPHCGDTVLWCNRILKHEFEFPFIETGDLLLNAVIRSLVGYTPTMRIPHRTSGG